MKKKKMTLRMKLTLFTITLFVLIYLLQMFISIFSSVRMAGELATPVIPAQTTEAFGMDVQSAVPIEKAQQNFNTTAGVTMLILIAGGCSCIYWFIKKELKPLETLAHQVDELNVENSFSTWQSSHGGDEIWQVAAAIQDMTLRVNKAYSDQKNFSANAAHELRTPLAILQNKLEVFRLKKDRSIEEYEELYQVLYQNVERLSVLVKELLQFTNQNTVNMKIPVSLSDLAQEAVMELEPLTMSKNISITVTGEASILGNDSLLQSIVFNLMQNAVKYNVDNGSVQVKIEKQDHLVKFIVSDTGIGIPEDARLHIFEPFFRVDKSRSREMGGNGLGLALTKRIVEQHGGKISVYNNMPQGTTFEVVFPE